MNKWTSKLVSEGVHVSVHVHIACVCLCMHLWTHACMPKYTCFFFLMGASPTSMCTVWYRSSSYKVWMISHLKSLNVQTLQPPLSQPSISANHALMISPIYIFQACQTFCESQALTAIAVCVLWLWEEAGTCRAVHERWSARLSRYRAVSSSTWCRSACSQVSFKQSIWAT